MHIDPTWPEGVVRQSHDCIFVQEPTREQAVETAARRIGLMERRCVGPGVLHEVFAREDYPERGRRDDHTKPVTIAPEKQQEKP